jgi:hypothetical protein
MVENALTQRRPGEARVLLADFQTPQPVYVGRIRAVETELAKERAHHEQLEDMALAMKVSAKAASSLRARTWVLTLTAAVANLVPVAHLVEGVARRHALLLALELVVAIAWMIGARPELTASKKPLAADVAARAFVVAAVAMLAVRVAAIVSATPVATVALFDALILAAVSTLAAPERTRVVALWGVVALLCVVAPAIAPDVVAAAAFGLSALQVWRRGGYGR